MAGEIPTLTLTVNLETSGVNTGVAQATASVKGIAAEADKTAAKFTNLKTVMLGTFASSALQKGFKELEGFLRSSVAVASEAQNSIAELGTAMNNAKINTEGNRKAVDDVTESMMNLGFTGNSTREALTKMVTATGSMTQAQKMMGVAADYARLKHMDLNEAASILTRGTVGAVRAFREYGIVLDTNLPKNQAITKAFAELNAKIGGQAQTEAQTYAGKLEILGVKSNDLKEKVGTLLLPVLTKLSTWFINSLEWIVKHKVAMEAVAALLGAVVTVVVVNLTKQLYLQAAAWIAANAGALLIVISLAAVAAGLVWAWNKSEVFRHGVVTAIEAVLDAVAFLVRAIGTVGEAFLKVVTGPLVIMLKALGFFVPAAKTAADEIGKMPKAVGDFFDGAANKIESFKKTVEKVKDTKIKVELPDFAKELATAGGNAGADPGIKGQIHEGAAGSKAAAAAAAKIEKQRAADEAKLQTYLDKQAAILKNRDEKMANAAADRDLAMSKARRDAEQRDLDIRTAYADKIAQNKQTFDDAIETATKDNEQKIIDIKQQYADKATQLQTQAAEKQSSIIGQSIDIMVKAFQNATKIDLGKLFTTSGETAGGLVSGLKDQLAQIKTLQEDAGKLAAAGYNQAFINEVIAQGPKQGDALAQSVLKAAPETQDSIKLLYDQVTDSSNNGINKLAIQMNDGIHFATQALAGSYKQVAVDLQTSLDQNAAALTDSLDKQQIAFQRQLDAAQIALDKANRAAADARDLALQKSAQQLADSLQSAQDSYTKATRAIAQETMKQLTTLEAQILKVMALLANMGGTKTTGKTVTATSFSNNPSYGTYGSSGTGAGYGVTYGPGIGAGAPAAPVIGSLTQNVYTTDPSLPTMTGALTSAITLGQTQGLINKPLVVSTQR